MGRLVLVAEYAPLSQTDFYRVQTYTFICVNTEYNLCNCLVFYRITRPKII